MADIRRCDDCIRNIQNHRLGHQNHINIDRIVSGGGLSLLPGLRPQLSGLPHRWCRERKIFHQINQFIQSSEASDFMGPQQFTTDFIVSNFWNKDANICIR